MIYIKNLNLDNGIKFSLNKLFENDSILLENNTHEQSFSHKIACYLTCFLNEYLLENRLSVDCEYNKLGKDPKEINGDFSKNEGKEYIVRKKGKDIKGKIIYKINKYCLCIINEKNKIIIGKLKGEEILVETQTIRPDIIIHERLENNNLCVFEIKKGTLSEKDILKLRGFTNIKLNFGYKYGVGLSEFNVSKKSVKIDVFINGKNEFSEKIFFNDIINNSIDESLN